MFPNRGFEPRGARGARAMPTTDFRSLPDIARAGAVRFGSLPALRRAKAAGGGGFTYEELWGVIRAGAAQLRREGLAEGDRVLLAAPRAARLAVRALVGNGE